MSSSVSPRDEVNAIVTLCELFGYGRVMQVASDQWQRKDARGALVVVCCAAERPLYMAAPGLLEALKGLYEAHDRQDSEPSNDEWEALFSAARAAIAKAEGRDQ